MDELKIGDKVAVMKSNGQLGYSEVYQFAHRDPKTPGLSYVKLAVASSIGNYSLTLSETHYITIATTEGSPTLITARAAKIGQHVWVMNPRNKALVPARITNKADNPSFGAYSPMTLEGNIIVDGVVASSFNDWSATDKVIPEAWRAMLPKIYNGLLVGHRLGYRLAGTERWAAWNDAYDLSGLSIRRSLTAVAVKAAIAMDRSASKI
eukprot:GHUV01010929.1.p1 GENE.GHUV01010929.1~~GHUV01010929.1.p1  ORF type:complete len:208 (+),score=36.05 GHUV01010929.1:518-1141(+)